MRRGMSVRRVEGVGAVPGWYSDMMSLGRLLLEICRSTV